MTTADPAAFDPDDERLSRFLDDDLDVEEAAALAESLADDPERQARLQLFMSVGDHLRAVAPAEDDAVDTMIGAALAAFDETFHVKHPAEAGEAPPVAPVTSIERVRQRRGLLRNPNALRLSAAAALVLVVALAALATRLGGPDGGAGDSAALSETAAATTFADQRAAADAALEQSEAPMAASEAVAGDGSTKTFGEAGAGGTAAGGAGPEADTPLASNVPTTTVAAPTTTTAQPPTVAAAPYQSVGALLTAIRSGALQPGVVPPSTAVSCDPALANGAIVVDQLVLWGTRPSPGGERIIVLDATSCDVLADEPR
ncbi:MAG: hypothetical protein AB7O92_10790 [Acidimicrobiia bacterium]